LFIKNREEFSKYYNQYAQSIYRYCFYRVYSKETAEDITQDVFVRAWEYFERKKIENPRPFLYRVARNLVIDFHRKQGKAERKKMSFEEILRRNKLPEAFFYNPAESLENNLLFTQIFSVMRLLPKSYQDLLVMRYVEDLKPKEIAKICNTTEKNISARKKRAIRKLDEILAKNNFVW